MDVSSWPFQIPLGALIPVRVRTCTTGLQEQGLPTSPTVATGCIPSNGTSVRHQERSPPTAWIKIVPRQVREDVENLEDFQRLLVDVLGFELAWPEPQRYESL